jgi:hypothetical protein
VTASKRKPIARSPGDEKILREIRDLGWTLMYIHGNSPYPDFGFTVGLYANYGHPEIVAVGPDRKEAAVLLNTIAEQVRDGRVFTAGNTFEDILEGDYRCAFVAVPKRLYRRHLGTARWYYGGDDFPALQAFVPNLNGHFVWEPDFKGDRNLELLEGWDPARDFFVH